jgi:AcrR family transcriptional regulator
MTQANYRSQAFRKQVFPHFQSVRMRQVPASTPPAPDVEPTRPLDAAAATPVARRRGRPRVAARDTEILDATQQLLEELGYDRLRIQDVADRAHSGLGAIYRRWPTKQALVIATMAHNGPDMSPQSEDPRADLQALLHKAVADLWGPRSQLLAGFLASLRTDPELAAAFRASTLNESRALLRGLIARIVGDRDPALDLRVDLAPALLTFRVLVGDEPTDPNETVEQLVALILSEHAIPDH